MVQICRHLDTFLFDKSVEELNVSYAWSQLAIYVEIYHNLEYKRITICHLLLTLIAYSAHNIFQHFIECDINLSQMNNNNLIYFDKRCIESNSYR